MRSFTFLYVLYKTGFAVLLVHHRVRQLGNFNLIIDLLHCSDESCGSEAARPPRSRVWRGATRVKRRLRPAKEAAMELRTRLNVLAAIVSFAFLTAVVFGMF